MGLGGGGGGGFSALGLASSLRSLGPSQCTCHPMDPISEPGRLAAWAMVAGAAAGALARLALAVVAAEVAGSRLLELALSLRPPSLSSVLATRTARFRDRAGRRRWRAVPAPCGLGVPAFVRHHPTLLLWRGWWRCRDRPPTGGRNGPCLDRRPGSLIRHDRRVDQSGPTAASFCHDPLRARHLLRLDPRVELLRRQQAQRHPGLLQRGAPLVRRLRDLRRVVVADVRVERRDQHQRPTH